MSLRTSVRQLRFELDCLETKSKFMSTIYVFKFVFNNVNRYFVKTLIGISNRH